MSKPKKKTEQDGGNNRPAQKLIAQITTDVSGVPHITYAVTPERMIQILQSLRDLIFVKEVKKQLNIKDEPKKKIINPFTGRPF